MLKHEHTSKRNNSKRIKNKLLMQFKRRPAKDNNIVIMFQLEIAFRDVLQVIIACLNNKQELKLTAVDSDSYV